VTPGLRADFDWPHFSTLVLPPGAKLCRLYKRPGGDWDPPDPKYRNLRVDPPGHDKSAYAVLYTAENLDTIGQECHILSVDQANTWTVNRTLEGANRVVRYETGAAGIFIPVDGHNATIFGLDKVPATAGYKPYQDIALLLFERFGHFCHGLSWRSFHRHQNGLVYAIWHSRKSALNLRFESNDQLATDQAWKDLLASIAGLREVY
jgi:hypothetical protein